MTDIAILATEAAKAAVAVLAKETAGAATAGAGRLGGWVKGKLAGSAVVAAVEAAPDKPSSATRLAGELQALLEDRPELAAELQALVREAATAAVQTAIITGDGSAINQIVGSGNTVSTRR